MESTPAPYGVGVGQQAELSSRYSASRVETKVFICTKNLFRASAQFIFHSALNIVQGDLFEGTSGLLRHWTIDTSNQQNCVRCHLGPDFVWVASLSTQIDSNRDMLSVQYTNTLYSKYSTVQPRHATHPRGNGWQPAYL